MQRYTDIILDSFSYLYFNACHETWIHTTSVGLFCFMYCFIFKNWARKFFLKFSCIYLLVMKRHPYVYTIIISGMYLVIELLVEVTDQLFILGFLSVTKRLGRRGQTVDCGRGFWVLHFFTFLLLFNWNCFTWDKEIEFITPNIGKYVWLNSTICKRLGTLPVVFKCRL